MPWNDITLSDGAVMPAVAFGTSRRGNGDDSVKNFKNAIDAGFVHIDTAQMYRNEVEAGQAIRQYPRDQIFVTTKWSGSQGLGVEESIHNSLKNLGLAYVDLYLIHSPRVAQPSIREAWAGMERLKDLGLVRSIGVSNFDSTQLRELLSHAKYPPVVNQIEYHPYVFLDQTTTVKYCAEHNIVVEGYSPLAPLTRREGPVRGVVNTVAKRHDVSSEMILLAWAKSKGVVVVTSSSQRWRLDDYIKAGDLKLESYELSAIEDAAGPFPQVSRNNLFTGKEGLASLNDEKLLNALEIGQEQLNETRTSFKPRYLHVWILLMLGLLTYYVLLPRLNCATHAQ